MNTVKLITPMGHVALYRDLQHVLDEYNKDANLYAIRVRAGDCELYHKGHQLVVGILDDVEE